MGSLKLRNYLAIVAISLIATVSFMVTRLAMSANMLTMVRQAKELLDIPDETDVDARVDYGAGPGVAPAAEFTSAHPASKSQLSSGGPTTNVTGAFGPAVTWPIIPIHVVLLPDGRVMNYGTNQLGQQGSLLIYDVWDPTLGTQSNAHLTLPNKTNSDIFCGAQSVMVSGAVLVAGGDLTVDGQRNFARNNTDIFSPSANTLTTNTPMHYARWYG